MEKPGTPAATARPHSQRPHSTPVNHPRIQAGGSRLTSPPLAVAAVALEGENAAPLLWAHRRLDQTYGWGGAQFIDAALAYITGTSADRDVANTERATFEAMISLARRLRHPRGR